MAEFNSNKNKALLWNLMLQGEVFVGVPEKSYEEVKSLFEKEMEVVSKMSTETNLTELNKSVLLELTKKINSLYKSHVSSYVPVTNEDIRDQRTKEFTEHLSIKQKDFNDFITLKKPSDIKFADAIDTPIEDNIDDILENMMLQREKDMNKVISTHNPELATKWIKEASPIQDKIAFSKTPKEVRFVEPEKKSVDILGFLGKSTHTSVALLHEMKKMHMDCIDKLNICIKQLEESNHL